MFSDSISSFQTSLISSNFEVAVSLTWFLLPLKIFAVSSAYDMTLPFMPIVMFIYINVKEEWSLHVSLWNPYFYNF